MNMLWSNLISRRLVGGFRGEKTSGCQQHGGQPQGVHSQKELRHREKPLREVEMLINIFHLQVYSPLVLPPAVHINVVKLLWVYWRYVIRI